MQRILIIITIITILTSHFRHTSPIFASYFILLYLIREVFLILRLHRTPQYSLPYVIIQLSRHPKQNPSKYTLLTSKPSFCPFYQVFTIAITMKSRHLQARCCGEGGRCLQLACCLLPVAVASCFMLGSAPPSRQRSLSFPCRPTSSSPRASNDRLPSFPSPNNSDLGISFLVFPYQIILAACCIATTIFSYKRTSFASPQAIAAQRKT